MRILQTHVDWIEYEPLEKEIKGAESVERKKHRLEDALVLFTCVEKGDKEGIAEKVIGDAKEFLKKIKANVILIYPFAHLSANLAKPADAIKIIKAMEEEAKKNKIEVHRAPFGWNKKLALSVKGHPLAEQSRVYGAAEGKAGKESAGIKSTVQRLGKRPTIEAEKLSDSDHRIIGQNLDLYSFHEVAPGMVFFHHKGMIIRNILEQFSRKIQLERGYQELKTPLVMSKAIWQISGHWEHYKDNMFFTTVDEDDYAVKPMNCPGAILVFKTRSRSYKDLPLRLAEFGLVHRNELSGVLSGLFRVRALTQDDAHLFVREDQLEDELAKAVELVDYFYKTFGFEYRVELSTRPEKSMGDRKLWDKAERALENALKEKKLKYKVNAGEGSFYGPKIDFHIKDSLGRFWQLATIQADFQMPERFDVSYVGEDGKNHRPVIIHRAIYGSLERFIGILVEHYQGKFPLWLAPVQVKILPISDENRDYAEGILEKLKEAGIRTELDEQSHTIQYKIREAQLQKIPFMIITGGKEEEKGTIAVRTREGKVEYGVKVEDFVKRIKEDVEKFR
ncbi:MAG: threonine--tRNA ligase [Candidatus Aenigmarchaeota archaeon]|nr:threonine--tRNA ligase [Candidatus Aenigmarchaeota archaeon]